MKKYIALFTLVIGVAVVSAISTTILFQQWQTTTTIPKPRLFVPSKYTPTTDNNTNNTTNIPLQNVNLAPRKNIRQGADAINIDFTTAAYQAIPTVVHITNKTANPFNSQTWSSPIQDMLGGDMLDWHNPSPNATGSGVLVSSDGYIVTNNHVIGENGTIEVTLHNNHQKIYTAEIIGRDKTTDLALIKIEAKGLSAIKYGDSDEVNIGEWVLAVGNPFNLTSTVTAGIVSAKARNINILKEEYAIESFIQTDAAINQGNSGGALVNLQGELVGINTAIATPSGTYTGYSFAVPVNIVSKVVTDLMEYGKRQEAYLGVNTQPITPKIIQRLHLHNNSGLYVDYVIEGSAADDASIQKDDIIYEINGHPVNSLSELDGQIALYRPGNQIGVTLFRKGKEHFVNVTLKNKQQTYEAVKSPEEDLMERLGAQFMELRPSELRNMGLKNGLQIIGLKDGLLKSSTTLREGFIIIKVNNKSVNSIEEFHHIICNTKKGDGVMLKGIYRGARHNHKLYAFSMK